MIRKINLSWMLLLGLMFTTATQLRFEAFPAGPGILLLSVWMILSIGDQLRGGALLTSWSVFWSAFFFSSIALLLLGYAVSLFLDLQSSPRFVMHDFMAFLVVFVFVYILTSKHFLYKNPEEFLLKFFMVLGIFYFLLLGGSHLVPRIGEIEFWNGNQFLGLSTNPNQLALLCSPAPFLLALQAKSERKPLRKMACWGGLSAFLIIGLFTRSDALVLGWIAGITFVLFASLMKIFGIKGSAQNLIYSSIVVGAGGVVLYGSFQGFDWVSHLYSEGSRQYEQVFRRFSLWLNAIEATRESPLVGLGPGNHTSFTAPFGNKEAHNSFVDWYSATGIMGVLLLALAIFLVWRSIYKANPLIAGAFVSLMAFSFLHYTFRHPIFWFFVVILPFLSRSGNKVTNSDLKYPKGSLGKVACSIRGPSGN
jgi:O-antigen ligase